MSTTTVAGSAAAVLLTQGWGRLRAGICSQNEAVAGELLPAPGRTRRSGSDLSASSAFRALLPNPNSASYQLGAGYFKKSKAKVLVQQKREHLLYFAV